MIDWNSFINADCMDFLPSFPDKYFDLAIVDPPYYSGPERRNYYGKKISSIGVQRLYTPCTKWEIPDERYFSELMRVSKNQIVWGCNYFNYQFGPGRIIWDKVNGHTTFSDCEIAYCSMHDSTRLFRYMWNGMMQGKSMQEGWIQQGNKKKNERRIHPTQKPVILYEWLLKTYAKRGDRILDTHVGSASSLIACQKTGNPYIGFEKDEYFFEKATERVNAYKSQISIFDLGIARN